MFFLIHHVTSKQIHLWEVLSAGGADKTKFPKWKLAFQIISEFQFSISKNLDLFFPSQSLGNLPWCFNFLLSSLPPVNHCLFQCLSNMFFHYLPQRSFFRHISQLPLHSEILLPQVYSISVYRQYILCLSVLYTYNKIFWAPSRTSFYCLGSILPPLRVHSVTHNYEFSNNVLKEEDGGGGREEGRIKGRDGDRKGREKTNNKPTIKQMNKDTKH